MRDPKVLSENIQNRLRVVQIGNLSIISNGILEPSLTAILHVAYREGPRKCK